MENMIEFEDSNLFLALVICLAVINIIFYFGHFLLIYKINKNNDTLIESSCLCIIFQLLTSSMFFGLLFKYRIKNTEILNISNLIGISLSLEWTILYMHYYNKGKDIFVQCTYAIPFAIILVIFFLFFIIDEFNKVFETILINLTFIFYILMFVSPGINIIKLFNTRNPKFILIYNSIIGVVVNILMLLFIIALNYYNIIDIYYITYICISLVICISEIAFYFYRINKDKSKNEDENKEKNEEEEENDVIDENFIDYAKKNSSNERKISLVSRKTIEDDNFL